MPLDVLNCARVTVASHDISGSRHLKMSPDVLLHINRSPVKGSCARAEVMDRVPRATVRLRLFLRPWPEESNVLEVAFVSLRFSWWR
jgi:hypothetical protein